MRSILVIRIPILDLVHFFRVCISVVGDFFFFFFLIRNFEMVVTSSQKVFLVSEEEFSNVSFEYANSWMICYSDFYLRLYICKLTNVLPCVLQNMLMGFHWIFFFNIIQKQKAYVGGEAGKPSTTLEVHLFPQHNFMQIYRCLNKEVLSWWQFYMDNEQKTVVLHHTTAVAMNLCVGLLFIALVYKCLLSLCGDTVLYFVW